MVVAWLLAAPAAAERIAACWAMAARMEAEQISLEARQAYLTRCIGQAAIEQECGPSKPPRKMLVEK